MADRNPFSVLADDESPVESGHIPSANPHTPFPKLSSLKGDDTLFERLSNYKRLAETGRYVAHYYPQYADKSHGIPRDYLLPLMLQYPTAEPVSIRHRDLEIDLLPLIYADEHYLLTAPIGEYNTWKQIARREDCKNPIKCRRKLHQMLGSFPIRSTTQFKSLLNTIDDLNFALGRPFEKATILDTDPGYGELFLASAASQLQYHGLQPHDIKRKLITQLNDELIHAREFELYETTVMETSLPVEKYELIYYSPKIDSDDARWSLTIIRELEALWPALKSDGYLIVQLRDYRELNAAAFTNRFIEQSLPRSSFYGTIGLFELNDAKATPVWIWSKSPDNKVLRWSNKVVVQQELS